ncbi:MAG: hypothetical protein MZV64_00040 [Ignavibacteriales bacterium]|nr:hypothetical protein [Ignavibacteriales bacterium]
MSAGRVQPVERRLACLDLEDRIALQVVLQVGGGVAGEHASLVDDRHAVAQFLGFDHVMGGQQQCAEFVCIQPAADQLADVARRAHVQAQGRLVEEEHFGVGQESAHDVHLLPQARREVGRFRVDAVLQPDHLQQVNDALVGFLRWHAVELREHPQVLAHGQQPVARRLSARDHVDARPDQMRVLDHVVGGDTRQPEVGARSVVRILIRVVLPAPFGPSSPNSSPRSTVRLTSSRATSSLRICFSFLLPRIL